MKRIAWTVLLALLFFVTALAAATAPRHAIDAWLDDCMKKDRSGIGVNACLGLAYEKWDLELNRVYRELNRRLDEEARTALRDAQRAWVAFRDRELAFLAKFYGGLEGTMYRSMLAADRVEVLRRRVLELSSFLDVLQQR